MVVLSLFDGISCGQLALHRANTSYDTYYASEIDKWAIKIAQKNFPQTIQLGSITNWREWNIERPNVILAGSPCQGFSTAGKGLNFEDSRSKLFFVFEDILRHYRPDYWLLENVQMKKEWRQIIDKRLGVESVLIDSSLVSAQSRKRLYWSNIPITQPQDKHIMLQSILEHGQSARDKSYCIDANYYKGGSLRNYIRKKTHSQSERRLANINPPRKLTPLECERLQTIPDNYTEGISNTQRYKCLGNAWTIDVIAHILMEFGA